MPNEPLSLSNIQECLERSGYLLESKLVRDLDARDFFVEPNQVVLDPRTGKSREIDLVAEYRSGFENGRMVSVKTRFIAEVVNNKYPFVLLTRRPSTPNADVESYV